MGLEDEEAEIGFLLCWRTHFQSGGPCSGPPQFGRYYEPDQQVNPESLEKFREEVRQTALAISEHIGFWTAAAKDFILGHVFGVAPVTINDPADVLRFLLHRHCRPYPSRTGRRGADGGRLKLAVRLHLLPSPDHGGGGPIDPILSVDIRRKRG